MQHGRHKPCGMWFARRVLTHEYWTRSKLDLTHDASTAMRCGCSKACPVTLWQRCGVRSEVNKHRDCWGTIELRGTVVGQVAIRVSYMMNHCSLRASEETMSMPLRGDACACAGVHERGGGGEWHCTCDPVIGERQPNTVGATTSFETATMMQRVVSRYRNPPARARSVRAGVRSWVDGIASTTTHSLTTAGCC